MKSKSFMIKKIYFWLIKSKMALCGVSGGILRELIKNNKVGSIEKSYDYIRRTSDMEFPLLNYRKNIEVIHFYHI